MMVYWLSCSYHHHVSNRFKMFKFPQTPMCVFVCVCLWSDLLLRSCRCRCLLASNMIRPISEYGIFRGFTKRWRKVWKHCLPLQWQWPLRSMEGHLKPPSHVLQLHHNHHMPVEWELVTHVLQTLPIPRAILALTLCSWAGTAFI